MRRADEVHAPRSHDAAGVEARPARGVDAPVWMPMRDRDRGVRLETVERLDGLVDLDAETKRYCRLERDDDCGRRIELHRMYEHRKRRRLILRQILRPQNPRAAQTRRLLHDRVVVRAHDDLIKSRRRAGALDRPGDERLTADLAQILAREPLAAAARGDDGEDHV